MELTAPTEAPAERDTLVTQGRTDLLGLEERWEMLVLQGGMATRDLQDVPDHAESLVLKEKQGMLEMQGLPACLAETAMTVVRVTLATRVLRVRTV